MRERKPKQGDISNEELQALRGNDANTWATVYERYNPSILKIASKVAGEQKAEDIAQEVWANFYTTIKIFTPDKPANYLLKSVRNEAIDEIRKEKRRPRTQPMETLVVFGNSESKSLAMEIPDQRQNTEEDGIKNVNEKGLLKGLQEIMGEDRAQTLYLASQNFIEPDIARIQNIPKGTVKSRINRGRVIARNSIEAISNITDIPVVVLEKRAGVR